MPPCAKLIRPVAWLTSTIASAMRAVDRAGRQAVDDELDEFPHRQPPR